MDSAIELNGWLIFVKSSEMGSWFSSEAGSTFEARDIEVSIENMESVEDGSADAETGPKRLGVDIVVLERLSMKYKLAGSDEVTLNFKTESNRHHPTCK